MLVTANSYAIVLTAICVWREARGESREAQRGVIWTLLNRSRQPAWWNGKRSGDIVSVILFPKQYSSFNEGDPNATRFPSSTDNVFNEILYLCIGPGEDPTGGATHYFDASLDQTPPSWAAVMTHTVDIGRLRFYK